VVCCCSGTRVHTTVLISTRLCWILSSTTSTVLMSPLFWCTTLYAPLKARYVLRFFSTELVFDVLLIWLESTYPSITRFVCPVPSLSKMMAVRDWWSFNEITSTRSQIWRLEKKMKTIIIVELLWNIMKINLTVGCNNDIKV